MKPPFTQVVHQYLKLIYFFAHRWVGKNELIDDIVQETFYRALQKYDSFTFSDENKLKAWLLTICRNYIYNSSRRKKEVLMDTEEMTEVPDERSLTDILELFVQREQYEAVEGYLKKRSFIDQELIRLYVYDELTFKEIADILHCSEGAAKKRFYRLLANIKKEVAV